ncbi:hypothetical protein [Almyronema epifaneia]|uniref:Uncharacterized protein n=1 Tax=Almyronema epifaneia S1 TaxID=2991925 RepID=A0ABW6ICJ9_9CYAN
MVDKAIPAGLKIWLTFLLGLLVVGYPIVPSILFGAIGGVAGGLVSAWWQTPGGVPTAEAENPLKRMQQRLRERSSRLRLPFGSRELQRSQRPRRMRRRPR